MSNKNQKQVNLVGAIVDLVNSLRADSKVDNASSSAAMSNTAMKVMMIRELKAMASDCCREEHKHQKRHKKRKAKKKARSAAMAEQLDTHRGKAGGDISSSSSRSSSSSSNSFSDSDNSSDSGYGKGLWRDKNKT